MVMTYNGYLICESVKVVTVRFTGFHNTQGAGSCISVNSFITYYC